MGESTRKQDLGTWCVHYFWFAIYFRSSQLTVERNICVCSNAWEKGTTEDEMVGWHHRLSGYEFEPTPGDSEGQASLVYCSSWGHKDGTRLSH